MAKRPVVPQHEVVDLPRSHPFLGLALRKRRGHVEVYMKTAPSRRWKLMLTGLISKIPPVLPLALAFFDWL